MWDTFEIRESGGWSVVGGVEVEGGDVLFTTKGYFATGSRAVSSAEVGGRTASTERAELRIPWDSPDVPADAVAVCIAIGPSTPARLLGRRVRVSGSGGDGSQRTHYPLDVTEVIS